MSFNCQQLKKVIIEPSLLAIGLFSDSAVNLLLGTCAVESQLGTYLIQEGIGFKGAVGIFQMQEPTFNDIWQRKVNNNLVLIARISLFLGYVKKPAFARLASDLSLAAIMARLFYANVSEPLPKANDIPGMAIYYKKYWNTAMGKATEQDFIDAYKKYII